MRLSARGQEVRIQGDAANVATVKHLIQELGRLIERGFRPSPKDVETAVRVITEDPYASLVGFFIDEPGAAKSTPKLVAPRSINQKQYLEAMREQDLVFAIGPAGTGKTYLAVAAAATFLLEKQVRRLVLTRPAVEAGEKLGFLPGDLVEKVNPYLRPLYDALYDIIGFDRVGRMIERQIIEIAPLAFMRGRTLNDSFIILDEAQNTTPRADEDVRHPHRLRLEGGGHRRHHPDRPSLRASFGVDPSARRDGGGRGHLVHRFHREGRGAPSAGPEDRLGLRPVRAGRGGAGDRAARRPGAQAGASGSTLNRLRSQP